MSPPSTSSWRRRRNSTVAVATATLLAALLLTAPSRDAKANAQGVGLGVAGGLSYAKATEADATSFSWGFFVDIPLLNTFYITPAATLYQADFGSGTRPTTDIDLNFKFLVPLGSLSVGAGVLGGVSNADTDYSFQVGALGVANYLVVDNLALFAMMQYKRLFRDESDADNIHVHLGTMFYF